VHSVRWPKTRFRSNRSCRSATVAMVRSGPQNTAVSFVGVGRDFQDDAFTGGSLVWTSSIDGQIGVGRRGPVSTFDISQRLADSHRLIAVAGNSPDIRSQRPAIRNHGIGETVELLD
jgi:hypothetical protein